MNQWRKGIVKWEVGKTLYMSIPFSWLLKDAELVAQSHKGRVCVGGPAVKLAGGISWAETPDTVPYDVLSMHNPLATFTTRGCPNSCSFCAVPKIEGDFRELDTWKPNPVICDNNLLAATNHHFRRVIESLKQFPSCDFNQGLDARLFKSFHADQLGRLKKPHIRFAFDHINSEGAVYDAIKLGRDYGLKEFSVYVLYGYKDTIEDTLYRLEKVREWGALPNPMRYQPLNCEKKNNHIAPGWNERELKRIGRYYSKLNWLGHIPFEDFEYLEFDKQQGQLL